MRSRFLLSLLCVVLFTNSQAQVLGSRLISLVNFQFSLSSFTPTDSTTYHYKGLMNSNMKTGVYNYDSSVLYTYSGSAYVPFKLSTKSYGPADSVTLLTKYPWNDTTNSWGTSDYSSNSNFDATTHLVTNRVIFTAGIPNSLQYTYDGSNNLIEILKLGPSGFDSLNRIQYTYDASNNMTSMLTQIWHAAPVPGFVNFQRTDYYYNAMNLDTFRTFQVWDPILLVWHKDNYVTSNYSSSKKLISHNYSLFVSGVGFINNGRDTIIYDTAGNVVNVTRENYDTMAHTYYNYKKTEWTYDMTWNNPLTMTTFSWSGSTWASLPGQDNKTVYHYEEYTDAVPEVNKAISQFQLFPVPAQNILNIHMKWIEPQAFTIAIYDMEGRLVQQKGETATSNYQRTLSVSELPSGTYMMQIKGANTAIAQQFTISK